MTVKFTPMTGNKVQVEAEGYIDPGGRVPTWAINFIQRSAPYSVMVGLQRMMRLDEYQKAKTPLPFTVYEWSSYN